jgi:hypothetical protein
MPHHLDANERAWTTNGQWGSTKIGFVPELEWL